MITYPSTFGVFEDNVAEICEMVHNFGGQIRFYIYHLIKRLTVYKLYRVEN